MRGRVLIIAGSDSGGGAGIQADIKTITAFSGYAMTALTAVTAQNTRGVTAIHPIPTEIVRSQISACLEDIGADVVKIGMLGDAATVETVASALAGFDGAVVLDPVMVAKGGRALLEPNAVAAVRALLVPRATIVTPNVPEAEALTGLDAGDPVGQARAAAKLVEAGAQWALVKGGHNPGPLVTDVLLSADQRFEFRSARIDTRSTHGTGCTLASAIAARLAQGASAPEAVSDARDYVIEAIEHAPGLGSGHGPLNHARFRSSSMSE